MDVDTQEVVHEVVGTDGMPIHDIVGAIQTRTLSRVGTCQSQRESGERLRGWVCDTCVRRGDIGALSVQPDRRYSPRPTAAASSRTSMEGDESTDPVDRDVVTEVRTWISEDGIEWTEASAPPFPYPWAGSVVFWSRPGAIVARSLLHQPPPSPDATVGVTRRSCLDAAASPSDRGTLARDGIRVRNGGAR